MKFSVVEEKGMKFTKMQAYGNDYVYIDAIHQELKNLPALARFVSDRHFAEIGRAHV